MGLPHKASRLCLRRMMTLNSDEEPWGCAAASRGVSLTSTTRRGDPKFAVVGGGCCSLGIYFLLLFGVCGLGQKFMAEVDLLYNPRAALQLRSVCPRSPRTNTCSKLPERPG